jgi:hypothetical protein
MALKQTSIFLSDVIGSDETIQLRSENATIQSALYGVDANNAPQPAKIGADKKSLTISIVAGLNALTVTLVSSSPAPETATLYQGNPDAGALADISVSGHTGSSALLIQGN